MQPLGIAIVGCGGMGRRHLHGLAELLRAGFDQISLVAACDLNSNNAEMLADEAAALLGYRPFVYTDIRKMRAEAGDIEAVVITTEVASHHRIAVECLHLGLHVLVEKPMGITVRASNLMLRASEESGRVLSIAENYRRDPLNRLIHSLITDGAIGTPRLMLESSIGGGDEILLTPWRHLRLAGTIVLDAGVHYADIMCYFLGEPSEVYAKAMLREPIRYRGEAGISGGFYSQWASGMPARIEATGEDAIYSLVSFAGDVVAQWTLDMAGHGESLSQRLIFGSRGSLACPEDRTGQPVKLVLDGGEAVTDASILDYAPSYKLDHATAVLFGDDRVWSYSLPFPEVDRKLLALELHELATCVRGSERPEVDAQVGRRAVALVYAGMESSLARRPVTLHEVEMGEVGASQKEIDQHLGLL